MTRLLLAAVAADRNGAPIVVGCDRDYPPFCMVDASGRADGFSVELIRHALGTLGHGAVFRTGPWAEVSQWLERGEVQVLPLVGRTPGREADLAFSTPYMTQAGAIIVRRETTGIERIEDLRGRSVAVLRGDSIEDFLRRADRGVVIHARTNVVQALRELAERTHDAVVVQRLVALRLIAELGLENLRVISRPVDDFRQDFCFAVKKGDEANLAKLNEGLARAMADGTFSRLYAKWFAALERSPDRRLVIGGDQAYPPYEYLDEHGQPAGFAVDISRAIARETGLDIEIRLGPWDETIQALRRGEIDALQGMYYLVERDREFDFSQPYLVSLYVGIVRKDSGRSCPETLADLKGLHVVVQKGDAAHVHLLEQHFAGRMSTVATQEEALRAVVEGRADCAIGARMSAMQLIEKHGWSSLIAGKQAFISLEYAYAVREGERARLALFAEGLRAIEQSGEYRRIHDKWMGVIDPPLSILAILGRLAWVVGPLVALLLFIFLSNRVLHRQVAARTAELHASEATLRGIFAAVPVGILCVREQIVIDVNDTLCRLTGYARDEIIGKELRVLHLNDAEYAAVADLQGMQAGLNEISSVETRWRTQDGQVRFITMNHTLLDQQDTAQGVIVSVQDITRHKQDDDKIRHLNLVLKAIRDVNQMIVREHNAARLIREVCSLLVNHRGYISAVIVLEDAAGKILEWAGAGPVIERAEVKTMLEQGEVSPCQKRTPADGGNRPKIEDRTLRCQDCPLAHDSRDTLSFCISLTHEGVRHGHLTVALGQDVYIDDEDRELLEELAGDLAYALHNIKLEAKRAEAERQQMLLGQQLAQAQKMESIGRLAGGVAHDFNNLLMAILGNIELGRELVPADHPIQEFLNEVNKCAERSTELTRQLLAFARRQTIEPKVLDLNDAITGMLRMLRRVLGENVDLVWRPGADVWPVVMDPSQVDQILANLCVNARDAINGIGKLTLATDNIPLDADACRGKPDAVPGDYSLLTVTDTGDGMAAEVLEHIFEPFFTTKKQGRGTGLGLSTVYGIVRQNNGFILVSSELGRGTTFGIYLPRAHGKAPVRIDEASQQHPPCGTETILLAEDEASVRMVAERFLKGLGYSVLTAIGAEAALRLDETWQGGFDLLLTDVIMPGMSGRELAQRMRERHPGLGVLVMSGYPADAIAKEGVLESGVAFLQKPISRMELALKLREVLDRRGA
jgi:PAS domain S-box-containing protein